MASSMKAAIHLGPDFSNWIRKSTRTQDSITSSNVTQTLTRRTFRRKSECEIPRPCLKLRAKQEIFITIMDEINIGQRSSDQMGEGKRLCLRWFRSTCWLDGTRSRSSREKMERPSWRSQDVDTFQDAVGVDGEAIEFEWKCFQDFRHCLFFKRSRKTWRRRTSNQSTSRTGSSSCQCSMTFCGKQMMRIASRTLRKSRITRRHSYQDIGHFQVQGRKRDGMATLTVNEDSVIAQPTKWYINSKKLVIVSSQVQVLWVVGPWSRKEPEVPFTSMEILWIRNSCFKQFIPWIRSVSMRPSRIGVINSVWQMKKKNKSLSVWTMEFWPWWHRKKWKCWYLFRTWHLETRCKGARASEYWKRGYRWHSYVKKPCSSILWQPEMTTDGEIWLLYARIFEFSSLPENSSFGPHRLSFQQVISPGVTL